MFEGENIKRSKLTMHAGEKITNKQTNRNYDKEIVIRKQILTKKTRVLECLPY